MKRLLETSAKDSAKRSRANDGPSSAPVNRNPFLKYPCNPEDMIVNFLLQSRSIGRSGVAKGGLFEIEARIGSLKSPYGINDMRVLSSGAKMVTVGADKKQALVNAFFCSSSDNQLVVPFVSGVSKLHFVRWTGSGLSEISPISQAYGVRSSSGVVTPQHIKRDLEEEESVETVFAGYAGDRRVCYPGEENAWKCSSKKVVGKMERKQRQTGGMMDLSLPSASYDLRLMAATEHIEDGDVAYPPPSGWSTKRLKRRRSYRRRDKSFAWQLDVTEVTTVSAAGGKSSDEAIVFEIELELSQSSTQKLIQSPDDAAAKSLAKQLSQQLWWMLSQINPVSDVLDVESYLRQHPDPAAVKIGLAQCNHMKRFLSTKEWSPAITPDGQPSPTISHNKGLKFIGCMPINFSRHNIEEVQRSDGDYFLSEKTDGVRYLMIFTGKTVVLLDRRNEGNQPVPAPSAKDTTIDSMAPLIPYIQPGTVLDGEVVIHRKLRRPMFIVFDVMCCGQSPLVQYAFSERRKAIESASFRKKGVNVDVFDPALLKNPSIALPLIRKNFVARTALDNLLSHVNEEKGLRLYRYGETHHHLTDGIIFQPNRPYVMGTDHHLLKWKYLDTVTIDVELLPPLDNYSGDGDGWRVGVLGEEGTMVDMTRYIKLPGSERLRLEADRHESGAKIAEVGFDPETGEWYYLTMRPDKIASNHISTVLGTLLELAECLGTNELRYRMNITSGGRDTYRKDTRAMQKQLLDHQRKQLKSEEQRKNGRR